LEELSRDLILGEGVGSGSFSHVSTRFFWLGVISAENWSPDGKWFLASEEWASVLVERIDETFFNLDREGNSRLGDTDESVTIAETCLLGTSDTGELGRAVWEESAPVSIRREPLISDFVRSSSCLS